MTALRRINLRTGAERLVQARRARLCRPLSLAFDGVVLFAGADGSPPTARAPAPACGTGQAGLPESVDVAGRRLYLLVGNALVGVDPGRRGPGWPGSRGATAASAGLYGVRAGAVLGLDHGALGKAWGYDVATQRVLWTSAPLPWPHYFVDPSGIGGSTHPGIDGVAAGRVCGARAAGGAGVSRSRVCGRS